jgi:hypothetical protein
VPARLASFRQAPLALVPCFPCSLPFLVKHKHIATRSPKQVVPLVANVSGFCYGRQKPVVDDYGLIEVVLCSRGVAFLPLRTDSAENEV